MLARGIVVWLALFALTVTGCSNGTGGDGDGDADVDGGGDGDVDTDVDTDIDTDVDSDSDTDSDTDADGEDGGDGGDSGDADADGEPDADGPERCVGDEDCDDGVGCTVDTCVDDACEHRTAGDLCDDDAYCNGVETCDPAAAGADPTTGCLAGAPPECGDAIDCTTDSCDEDADDCVHTPVDAACDDGLSCTGDVCSVAAGGCVSTPDSAGCDDGAYCNGVETCDPADPDHDATTGCVEGTAPDCSDGASCTADSCDEDSDECVNTADDVACDDDSFCSGVETCAPGAAGADATTGCLGGAAPDCSDGATCTDDTCDDAAGGCVHTAIAGACDDSLFCNGDEVCTPGAVGADAVTGCAAGPTRSCDDGIACTTDSCDEGGDACVHAPDHGGCDDGFSCTTDTCDVTHGCTHTRVHTACGDGQYCNGVESCAPSAAGADPTTGCIGGAPPDCDDAISCTVDTCDETADACDNAPSNAACDDSAFCNGAEVCSPESPGASPTTGCLPGTAPSCNDGISCTVDSCDPAGGGHCVNATSDALCDDGAFCNGDEACAPGTAGASPTTGCVAGTTVDCTDPYACTSDRCDEAADDCVNTPVDGSCRTAFYCDGDEYCVPTDGDADARGCVTVPRSCTDDGFTCTVETCDEFLEDCVSTPNHALCGAGYVCTADVGTGPSGCEPGMSCTDSAECSDHNVCNGIETCSAEGICQPGTPLSCDDGVACTDDTCDPATGCESIENDDNCSNSLPCDGLESCDATLGCLPGIPLSCDDGTACTVDSCNDAAGGCVNTPMDSMCDDGVFCNGAERCTFASGCVAGTPPSCADAYSCTLDTCDAGLDSCVHTPRDTACDNSAWCDGSETCAPGTAGSSPTTGCLPGTTRTCNDGIGCSVDSCNEATDECSHVFDSGLCPGGEVCTASGCHPGTPCTASTAWICDDGLFCNGAETCSSSDETPGVCQGGLPPACSDSNACTIDGCSDTLGACTHTPRDRDLDGYGDCACAPWPGCDCDDLDPAVHPGAEDVCDGRDNDCDYLVDGGLASIGDYCAVDGDCCTGACAANICTLADGECGRPFATCTDHSDCCTGLCATMVDGVRRCQVPGGCGIEGATCAVAADCCSTGCVDGECDDATRCVMESGSCMLDEECCSDHCSAGHCADPGTSCLSDGEACSSHGNCCSGFCLGGYCSTDGTCRAEGEVCTVDDDCCTGGCDEATRTCFFLGSCSTAGEPCTSVRSCCSALCVLQPSGIGMCEFLSGCRPFGEVCEADYECCSSLCDADEEVPGVRRCVNPPGCVDPGEICAQGGSNNCCILKSRGCVPTGLGVSRCNDTETCVEYGDPCDYTEQCCDELICSLWTDGVRRCGDCVPVDGVCLSHLDCCEGLCIDGACDAGGGCAPLGGPCTTADDCCSGICTGGICGGLID